MSLESMNHTEKTKEKVTQSLEQAKRNPIFESRITELESQLNTLKDTFIKQGSRSAEMLAEENAIEAEIMQSSALADNIPEYREMLSQIASSYGLSQEWADDLLAHENAHANVAEVTEHEWVGYAAIFIKDENNNLTSIQPVHFTKPQLSWGPKELLEKSIEVTKAPEEYGNRLSEGDDASLTEDTERLKALQAQEELAQIQVVKEKLLSIHTQ